MEEERENEPVMEVSPFTSIPDAILFAEILPKLPLKSLMRFKCVSKSWNFLISSTKFAKLVLQLSKSKPRNHGVFIETFLSRYAVPNYACYDQSDDLDFELLKKRFQFQGFEGPSDFIDSCNGLLCFQIRKKKELCVFNPITQKYRRIPFLVNGNTRPFLFAFGYDPSHDDYKIVCFCLMLYDSATKGKICDAFTRVYSLRNDVWKEFKTDESLVLGTMLLRNSGVVLDNGKCHWLRILEFKEPGCHERILVFDLVTETYNVMMLPQELNGRRKRYLREQACIGTIEDNLCLASQGLAQDLEVWVMERYGEEDSWSKLLKVSGLMTPAAGNIKFCTLCMCGGSEKLLLHLDKQVWFYDWSESIPRCALVEGSNATDTRRYVPSLISPDMLEVREDQ